MHGPLAASQFEAKNRGLKKGRGQTERPSGILQMQFSRGSGRFSVWWGSNAIRTAWDYLFWPDYLQAARVIKRFLEIKWSAIDVLKWLFLNIGRVNNNDLPSRPARFPSLLGQITSMIRCVQNCEARERDCKSERTLLICELRAAIKTLRSPRFKISRNLQNANCIQQECIGLETKTFWMPRWTRTIGSYVLFSAVFEEYFLRQVQDARCRSFFFFRIFSTHSEFSRMYFFARSFFFAMTL